MSARYARLRELIRGLELGDDALETLYEFQRAYQEALGDARGGPNAVRRNLLAAFVELGELAQALPLKWYRRADREIDHEAVAGEFADVLAFALNALMHAGLTREDVRRGVLDTMRKNLGRLEVGLNQAGVNEDDAKG